MPGIPKRIFVYWASGFEKAPEIVHLCVSSWQLRNPEFTVIKLDDSNLAAWIDLDRYLPPKKRDQLTIQKFSNLVRAALLVEHGGLWVDATLYCRKPIRSWLDTDGKFSFVAIAGRGQNRFIQNYFLVSTPSSFFLSGWLRSYVNFLGKGYEPMTKTRQKRLWRKFQILSSTKLGTVFWTLPPVANRVGFPYLIMHYLANRLIFSNPRFAWEFYRMPKIVDGEGLRYQEGEKLAEFRQDFQSGEWPLWKLTWRTYVSPDFWNSALKFIRDDQRAITIT